MSTGKINDVTFGPMVYDHEPNDDIKITILPHTVQNPAHQITVPSPTPGIIGIGPAIVPNPQFINGNWNPCGEISLGGVTFAKPNFSIPRHAPFKSGQLVLVNWTLAKHAGQNASLFAEPRLTSQGQIPSTWVSTNILAAPAPLHTFEGREAMIVLEDVNEDDYEAKVCWDEKVGYVCAYLLLEHDVNALPPEVPRRRRSRRVVRNSAQAEQGSRSSR